MAGQLDHVISRSCVSPMSRVGKETCCIRSEMGRRSWNGYLCLLKLPVMSSEEEEIKEFKLRLEFREREHEMVYINKGEAPTRMNLGV